MTSKEFEILTNIIGAVESGGQVYGQRNYAAYAPAYHASPDEHTCTLGWCQLYGGNANKLLNKIYAMDKSAVPSDIVPMLNVDWVAKRWNPSASQKQSLIKAITSVAGKKCQDEMFKEITEPVIKKAESLGITDVGCQIMYVEIAHLGGASAAQRIFNKASKPYTVDGIFNTLMLDQKDTSNNNQVGDKTYQSRHECCVKWIKQYLYSNNATSAKGSDKVATIVDKAINAVIALAKQEDGYIEKNNANNLDSKTAGAGSGNYTKYWRDLGMNGWQGQPYCAAFISWLFMKVFGQDTAKKLLKHWPFTYCPTLASMTTNKTPKVGSIVLFYRNGEYVHTGYVIGVTDTTVTTAEGNTSGGSTIVANGGQVVYGKVYNRSSLSSYTKYFMPDYSIVTKINGVDLNASAPAPTTTTSEKPWKAKLVRNAKVRTWAGTEYGEVSFSPLKKNTEIEVQYYLKANDGTLWYYFKYQNKYAFIPAEEVEKVTATTTTTTTTTANKKTQFRVQAGVYSVKANAKSIKATLKQAGYEPIIVTVNKQYIVQLGMFDNQQNAMNLKMQLNADGFDAAVIAIKV